MAQSEQGQAESMPGTAMTSQSATLNQPATQNQGSRLVSAYASSVVIVIIIFIVTGWRPIKSLSRPYGNMALWP